MIVNFGSFFAIFYEIVLKRKAWFKSQGYVFGLAFLKDADENYRWE